MENLEKALKGRLRKAKYRKRTGGPGHYKYFYGEGKGRAVKKQKEEFPGLKEKMAAETKAEVRARTLNGIVNKNDTGDSVRVIPVDGKLYYGNMKQSKTYKEIKEEIKNKIEGTKKPDKIKKKKKISKEEKADKVYDELMEEGEIEHDPDLYDMIETVIEENPDFTVKDLIDEVKASIEGW